ncbi:Asp23/Gls24 family envelope stress response protein [Desulfofundulus sp.]|uniref:Asp23/Gls24 family envelope stress response protein n=1 Tax=Desulfofundulus sp. TaxID=2282750 RepID=UPI003C76FCFF
MEVFALVGPSGTGKSFRAIATAHEFGAELIIDDGLLIKGNRILGGVSAKRQSTRIGAIKVALFMDEEHVRQARAVLEKEKPSRVLVLGTSVGMVEKIAERLGLPQVSRIISIEEIASPREIRQALTMRTRYSKHVIPAPTVEVKKRFPDMIADSLRIFTGRKGSHGKRSWLEQSVVRPTFTCYGKLTITTSALVSIISRVTEEVPGVKSAGRVNVQRDEDGVIIEVQPVLYYGFVLNRVGREIQQAVKIQVEEMTGLVVKYVNILIKELFIARVKEPV